MAGNKKNININDIKKEGFNLKKQESLESKISISYVDKLNDGHKFEAYIAKILK